jgi:nucleotide-binding universal stress UspA family protein
LIIRHGNIVKTIIDAALEYDVDLIVMPTAGHHGILDALRGSTTERVLRHAPCPVYAVPVG